MIIKNKALIGMGEANLSRYLLFSLVRWLFDNLMVYFYLIFNIIFFLLIFNRNRDRDGEKKNIRLIIIHWIKNLIALVLIIDL